MADNFRNKQWFKKLSQEQKDEICKQFDITEATLKKAGRETEDGRIVVDLLRIDHLIHHPEEWDTAHECLKGHDDLYKKLQNASDRETIIKVFEEIYDVFGPNKYLKFKDSTYAKVLISQTYKHVLCDYAEYLDIEEDRKAFYAHRIQTHLRVILDSDLKLIKK